MARYYVKKELETPTFSIDEFYDSIPCTLIPEGLCFYYWVGDAVAPLELIIPYTDDSACVISVEEALMKIGYEGLDIEIERYLDDGKLIISGHDFADKGKNMSFTEDYIYTYSNEDWTFIMEADYKDAIFRIVWSDEPIAL